MLEVVSILTLTGVSYLICVANAVRERPIGSFTVKGYKNGVLVYQETIVNDRYEVEPGDDFDLIEITG